MVEGNENIISDILNVYVEGNEFGYAASNSLPSYDIKTNIIEETLVGSSQVGLTGFDPLTRNYTTIQFSPPPNTDIKFNKEMRLSINQIAKHYWSRYWSHIFCRPSYSGPNQINQE